MNHHFLRLELLVAMFSIGMLAGCSGTERSETKSTPLPTTTSESTQFSGAGLKFEAPSAWIQAAPSSSMRLTQYRLPRFEGEAEDTELVVYYFGGQGGSVQANVNRWIGQFSNADGSSVSNVVEISEKDVHEIHLTIVDVSGTYQEAQGPMMANTTAKPNYRMLAAVAEGPGGPWFFKLTGPQRTVDDAEETFHSLVGTLRLSRTQTR